MMAMSTKPSAPPHYVEGARYDLEALIASHVFILASNNTGSTLLKALLTTGQHTWWLRNEGHFTFGFHGMNPAAEHIKLVWNGVPDWRRRYRLGDHFDWPKTRRAWYFQAMASHPEASIFVEKSPPFLLVAEQLAAHFRDARFILLVRDPYATAESILRKAGVQWRCPPDRELRELVAAHIVQGFQDQEANQALLGKRALMLRYEDLCAAPQGFQQRLAAWLPLLDDVDMAAEFCIKGVYHGPIRDMNQTQIERLTSADFLALTAVFARHEALFARFGYDLRHHRHD